MEMDPRMMRKSVIEFAPKQMKTKRSRGRSLTKEEKACLEKIMKWMPLEEINSDFYRKVVARTSHWPSPLTYNLVFRFAKQLKTDRQNLQKGLDERERQQREAHQQNGQSTTPADFRIQSYPI